MWRSMRVAIGGLLVAACSLPLAARTPASDPSKCPGGECRQLPPPPAPPRLPAPPAVPAVAPPPRLPAPPPPPQATAPHVRLGFSFECRSCGVRPGAGGERAWTFADLPVIDSVEAGGPADTAGFETGDRLTHLDGIPMNSPEAGRRFTALQPGQAIVWTVERGGEPRKIRMVAQLRPADEACAAGGTAERLRYTGAVRGAQIEVRGAA